MRLIIFDMDGTLIDSARFLVGTIADTFREAGEDVPDDRTIRSISGLTLAEALATLAPQADDVRVSRLVDTYRRLYRASAGKEREPLFADALDALDRLRMRDDTILAIATGKGHRGATALLDAHGLAERFHSVQTPDHNRGKPDPQMIETAMARAGAQAAETVMIGDTVHDMRMARAAGVAAIGVAWGYHLVEELEEAGADIVIHRFADLDSAIDRLLG